jgi:hypothetical protein
MGVVLTEARGRYQTPWSLSYRVCEQLGTESGSSARSVHTLTADLCFQPLELNLKLVDSIAMFSTDYPVLNEPLEDLVPGFFSLSVTTHLTYPHYRIGVVYPQQCRGLPSKFYSFLLP